MNHGPDQLGQQLAGLPKFDLEREIEAVSLKYGLGLQLPPAIADAATELSFPDAEKTIAAGRRDLRNLELVTIDGADSQDFDDAVHCRKTATGDSVLTVVIADVSNFVEAGGTIDKEAADRTTSAYFPGTVLPMLPPLLSNDWCSLKPGEERLGLACTMVINALGKVLSHVFFECVMKSRRRLTYGQADKIMAVPHSEDEVGGSLHSLAELARILERNRRARGGLQFDIPALVVEEERGVVKGFRREGRLFAHVVIEECMLAANISAAKFLSHHKYPFLYRVHDKPEKIKVRRLQAVLREFGIKVGNLGKSRDMQKVIESIIQQPAPTAQALLMNVLRTLQRAQYTPTNVSHYGLGYEQYTHFTSPIRRYPDLLVHRAIKAVLRGQQPPRGLAGQLADIGLVCSEREMAAERAGLDLLSRLFGKAQAPRVGEVMEGAVSGMSKGGMFVLCVDGVEGMVRFSSIKDDYYELNQHQTAAVGRRRRRNLCVGMIVSVRLTNVKPEDGRCEMELEG